MAYAGEWDYPAQVLGANCPRCGVWPGFQKGLTRIGMEGEYQVGKICMGCLATWPLLIGGGD